MSKEKFITKEENQEENEGKLKILQPKKRCSISSLIYKRKRENYKSTVRGYTKDKNT